MKKNIITVVLAAFCTILLLFILQTYKTVTISRKDATLTEKQKNTKMEIKTNIPDTKSNPEQNPETVGAYNQEKQITKQEPILLSDFSYRTNKACDDLGDDGVIEIEYKSRPVGKLYNQLCPIEKLDFFALLDDNILFSIEPGGLGGYYIYRPHFNIYVYNIKRKEISKIAQPITGITGVDPKKNTVAFIEIDENRNASVSVLSLESNNLRKIAFKQNTDAQFGHLVFSPDGSKLAVEVGYGPDSEQGEIYILDIKTQKINLTVSKNFHLKIDSWKNNNEVNWSEWK